MKQENADNRFTVTPTHCQLEQRLEENRRQLAQYNEDMAQKHALLAKLNTEIEEMNKLYRGHKRQA